MVGQVSQLWKIVQAHIDAQPYPPSERQIAMRLGVSPTTLANWRTSRIELPKPENLMALADLTGVSYDKVLQAALDDSGYAGQIAARRGVPDGKRGRRQRD
jgi:transcriptional regulator with XRE-family HTH domain